MLLEDSSTPKNAVMKKLRDKGIHLACHSRIRNEMELALYRRTVTAFVIAVLAAATHTGFAGTQKSFFQNNNLNDGNNYSPAGLPSSANDVLLTTSAAALNLSGASLSMGSLNQTNTAAYTVSNNTSDSTTSFITLGGGTNTVGADPNDLIYLGGATSSLTLQGANGGTGSGILVIGTTSDGNIDVAQTNSTLNISAAFNTGASHITVKTGAGTLNVSALFGGNGGFIKVNDGTMNFLPGASMSNDGLSVNNPNVGPASAVIINMQTSIFARGLTGSIAAASSGTNTATINLMGAGIQLTLDAKSSTTSQYQGDITGAGSVTVTAPDSAGTQIFTGHNTYTGGTTVSGGTLLVNNASGSGTGTGAVQVTAGTLGGTGTIAGAVTVGTGSGAGAFISPGASPGTLTIQSALTLNSDATYRLELNSSTAVADKIVANGVTINGAAFSLTDLGNGKLTPGTTFVVIDNTSTSPITGVFGNLLDNSTFTNNGNTYQVSYEGGTGNDLTLTVIPEPLTWELLGIGALVTGRMMRFRKDEPHC
jgi:autotransporter-associated beta strand protein